MKRISFLWIPIALLVLSSCVMTDTTKQPDIAEFNLMQLQQKLRSGELSAVQIYQFYVNRIERFDRAGPSINSVARINPQALAQAKALDQKVKSNQPLGSLFGAFILVKDNVDIAAMPNTAGSWLLKDHIPASNAFIIDQLIQQDAIILGKTNLSEWANFRSTNSSSGWSSLYGQTLNPHDITRSPCGSSAGSGAAIAANFGLIAIGTETDGSITCPAAVNGVVGIKPTLGLVSRSGIIPIAHSQDTAGPMARSVEDAHAMLVAMLGKDSEDSASFVELAVAAPLQPGALKGKRIGIVRNYTGYNSALDQVFEQQLQVLREAGAELVDDADIETRGEWGQDEYTVLLAEFKADLKAYLTDSGAPFESLEQAIALNQQHAQTTMPIFGQEIFLSAQDAPGLDQQDYLDALAKSKEQAGKLGIDATLQKHNLDLLIAPTTAPAWKIDHILGDHYQGSVSSPAAVSGYPHVTVPMGQVKGMPVGISFFSTKNTDAMLINVAFDYEQRTGAIVTPAL